MFRISLIAITIYLVILKLAILIYMLADSIKLVVFDLSFAVINRP